MLKQHRELSMSVRRTIDNNEEAGSRPSKTYQSFVAAAEGHHELNFIKKDVRNYITREYGLGDNKWLFSRAVNCMCLGSFTKTIIYGFQFISSTTSGPGLEAHKGARTCMLFLTSSLHETAHLSNLSNNTIIA
ncbi:hypothetical protein Ahy_B02g060224 [Arachis hypogaea]|uniref:Uncharacterized protein n=1 Tax=Arachis hypogaea TaxID=3818 RepID=A0A445AI03_ARAHY|nr:hypothetical protein Ahy_B02g060224 [Arachis hypogaea]